MNILFKPETYIERRRLLKKQVSFGIILFLGNEDSPMNYADNPYPFRQDSSFLYFFGLDSAGLAAVIDIDKDREIVFGDDLTVEQMVWMKGQAGLVQRCEEVGVGEAACAAGLGDVLDEAVKEGRKVHFLPPYRAENSLKIQRLLGMAADTVKEQCSETL